MLFTERYGASACFMCALSVLSLVGESALHAYFIISLPFLTLKKSVAPLLFAQPFEVTEGERPDGTGGDHHKAITERTGDHMPLAQSV